MLDTDKRARSRGDTFAHVAFWQLMVFVVLLAFVCASELMDLPALLFGTSPTPFNLYRLSVLCAAIITGGIIAVGQTYQKQKSVVEKIVMACLYCHRVKTDQTCWQHVEQYFMDHFPIAMSRGVCPECQKMLDDIDARSRPKQEGGSTGS